MPSQVGHRERVGLVQLEKAPLEQGVVRGRRLGAFFTSGMRRTEGEGVILQVTNQPTLFYILWLRNLSNTYS